MEIIIGKKLNLWKVIDRAIIILIIMLSQYFATTLSITRCLNILVRISGEEESLENVTFENRIATDSIERAYLLYTARKSWLSYLVSYSTRYAVQPTTRSDGVLGPRATPEGTRGRVERDLSTWVVHSPYACII